MFYNVEGNWLCIHRAYPQTPIPPRQQAVTDRWLETLGTLLSLPIFALLILAVWLVIT